MNETLKHAADSTVHALSDLVGDAHDRLEHVSLPSLRSLQSLPALPTLRSLQSSLPASLQPRRRGRNRWVVVVGVMTVAVSTVLLIKRAFRKQAPSPSRPQPTLVTPMRLADDLEPAGVAGQ